MSTEDGGVGAYADDKRRELTRLHAAELAAVYEEARLIIQAPVLLLVESGDSLGRRLLEDWLPRPKRWLRRARALQPGALQPAYLIFVKDFESAWQFLEKAGGHQQLKPPQPGHLCVVVIALEGVSFCYLDLQD